MFINGVEFFEDAGDRRSPMPRFAADSVEVRRWLQIRDADAADCIRAAEALLGTNVVKAELVNGTPRLWIERQPPHGYPWVPSVVNPAVNPCVFATAITECQPLAAQTDLDVSYRPRYGAYRLNVQYTALPYEIRDDGDVLATAGPLAAGTPPGALARPDEGDALRRGWGNTRHISKFVRGSPRTVTLPQGFVKRVSGNAALRTAINHGLPYHEFRASVDYVWHAVPYEGIPWTAYKQCANGVNDAEFDRYDAETLLFSSVDVRPLRGPLGDRLADVTVKCIWAPNRNMPSNENRGWNSTLQISVGQPVYLYVSSDGVDTTFNDPVLGKNVKIFTPVSFPSLFRPDQS